MNMAGSSSRPPISAQSHPLAREGILVTELEGEALVYEPTEHRAHCLNDLAYRVFCRSDGRTSLGEIAAALSADLGQPVEEAQVVAAVRELDQALLLVRPVIPTTPRPVDLGRRRAVGGLARTAALCVAAPMVWSIVAPSVAQAASAIACLPPGGCSNATTGMCCDNGGKAAGTCNGGTNCGGGQPCNNFVCQ